MDPLYDDSGDDLIWTTSNFAEVIPGVQTPLSVSIWTHTMDWATRETMYRIGVITAAERNGELPYPLKSPLLRTFYGRVAMQVELFAVIGDRIPGATGEGAVEAMLGRKPDGIRHRPTRSRYPMVALRVPHLAATMPGRIRRANAETRDWYLASCSRILRSSVDEARSIFAGAWTRFDQAVALQAMATLAVVQPLYEAVESLVATTGIGDAGVFSGSGSPEVAGLITSIWQASRGDRMITDVQRLYGYHGPAEGELESRSWREDPGPLEALVKQYSDLDDSAEPAVADQVHRRRRTELTMELLHALPLHRRPAARAVLALAARRIPLRGAAKESFLRAFDVARAAARRAGDHLAERGSIDNADDVFFLTATEVLGPTPKNAAELIAERRERRARCSAYTLPSHWTGSPPAPTSDATAGSSIEGIGVSAGIAIGIARVLPTPDFDEFEPGEILVAAYTDPGWASVMFLAAGLVVDIGGALSHAAVVARELGLPCVVNTQNGTRHINSGDQIRVDGGTGQVDILHRADPG